MLTTASDVAHLHAVSCASKHGYPPPVPAKRGRKFRACDQCAQSKVSCDLGFIADGCTRCRKQGFVCSFIRRETRRHSGTPQAPFLLSYTAARGDSKADPFVSDAVKNDMMQPLTIQLRPSDDVAPDCTPHLDFLYGPIGAFPFSTDDPMFMTSPKSNLSDYLETKWTVSALDDCMKIIVDSLAETYNSIILRAAEPLPPFDMATAEQVFTTPNALVFITSYFRDIHCYMSFVHLSTLEANHSSVPLLMMLFLAGSFFSPPNDDAIAARGFLRLAEEFIFHQALPQARDELINKEHVQRLQAALITIILQGEINDSSTRRRIRQERFPKLVGAVRSLNLAQTEHLEKRKSWLDYIADEVNIR
ncbi:hypothetical protein BS50DRAFT_584983 [Corynespora cassiicola Philippines]|uniref:Zn(2)-C6 fungal-type domain-containing protein n=1 Tax=Corynespora cassiicola Philippines TaxID=1448308 RepID=A0A2T2P1F8_CORCC|nr:hypothetical protein BS50DRAFT_584983 [Corynespora cassiicola Philippines]